MARHVDGKTGFAQTLLEVVAGFGFVLDDQDFHGWGSFMGYFRLRCPARWPSVVPDNKLVIFPTAGCGVVVLILPLLSAYDAPLTALRTINDRATCPLFISARGQKYQ
jgi:hypothetical protein